MLVEPLPVMIESGPPFTPLRLPWPDSLYAIVPEIVLPLSEPVNEKELVIVTVAGVVDVFAV
jgi:hypothetical protein